MLPIALNIRTQKVILVGRGIAGQQRYSLLKGSGAERLTLFAIHQDGWACHAEALLHERLPEEIEFAGARVVFIAGLERELSEELAGQARKHGALVNVEDVPELCDFHVPAIVRRGDLLLAVSTGGRAPGLAQRLRSYLESVFGAEWEQRLQRLGDARSQWRAEGLGKGEVALRAQELIDSEGWLDERIAP